MAKCLRCGAGNEWIEPMQREASPAPPAVADAGLRSETEAFLAFISGKTDIYSADGQSWFKLLTRWLASPQAAVDVEALMQEVRTTTRQKIAEKMLERGIDSIEAGHLCIAVDRELWAIHERIAPARQRLAHPTGRNDG